MSRLPTTQHPRWRTGHAGSKRRGWRQSASYAANEEAVELDDALLRPIGEIWGDLGEGLRRGRVDKLEVIDEEHQRQPERCEGATGVVRYRPPA